MTRIKRFRFRRLVVVAAVGLGTFGLAVGTAAASTTGNPTPSSSYGQHHHKMQPRHCEFVELTGQAADNDHAGSDVGGGYGSPKLASPNDQGGKSDERQAERVEVFQLAKVCETGEHLTVTDISAPYVEETEPGNADHHGDNGYPTPDATPASSYTG